MEQIPETWITVINNFGGWSLGMLMLWCTYSIIVKAMKHFYE